MADIKAPDIKAQDTKVQDVKAPDFKTQDVKPQDNKLRDNTPHDLKAQAEGKGRTEAGQIEDAARSAVSASRDSIQGVAQAAGSLGERNAEAGARGASMAGDLARQSGTTTAAATENAARQTADATQRSAGAAAQMGQHGAAAGARVMQRASEAMGENTRRGARAVAEGQQNVMRAAAEQLDDLGGRIAGSMEEMAQAMRTLMSLPGSANGGVREIQGSIAQLMEGVIRTHMRAQQDMVRMINPGALLDLQRRYARDYLDAVMESSANLARATRRAADETLRPLEERIQAKQSEQHGQGDRSRQGNGHQKDAQEQQHEDRVADAMTRQVRIASPDDTVQQVARMMREEDTGVLPVGEHDRLVGMVTDRDLAVRLVADGRDPANTKVRDVMTPDVTYVFEDERLHDAAQAMARQQVRRVPVLNRQKRLVGVLSLGDLTQSGASGLADMALHGAARPGGQHAQSAE